MTKFNKDEEEFAEKIIRESEEARKDSFAFKVIHQLSNFRFLTVYPRYLVKPFDCFNVMEIIAFKSFYEYDTLFYLYSKTSLSILGKKNT